MCLEKRDFRHNKGNIVDICYHPAVIHTSSTRVDTKTNSEEQVVVNLQRDSGWILFRVQASERVSETVSKKGGVSGRHGSEGGEGGTKGA